MRLGELIRWDDSRFLELAEAKGNGRILHALLHPRVAPVAWFRIAHWLHAKGWRRLASCICLLVLVVSGAEFPARAIIGHSFVLPHPNGVVIGSAEIGNRVTLFQHVTLGSRRLDGRYDLSLRPRLGHDVIVGAGATVLGPIGIGDGAVIAANSLVLLDVPPGGHAIGVPAKVSPERSST